MLQLNQKHSFSDLHLSLERPMYRVIRYLTSFLASPCFLKRKGYVDAPHLTGYEAEGFVHSDRIPMEGFFVCLFVCVGFPKSKGFYAKA